MAESKRQLWVSESFAYGFLFSNVAEFFYKTIDCYAQPNEQCIIW